MNPYMQTVLDSECAAILGAFGGRNVQLNKSALNVCAYIKGGSVDESTAKAAIWNAAAAVGLTAGEFEATWKSAHHAANPRTAPEPTGKGWRGQLARKRNALAPAPAPIQATKPKQTAAQCTMFRRIAARAFDALWTDTGAPGLAYLKRRGLHPDTAHVYNIGYCDNARVPGTGGSVLAPAIVLPWYRGAQVCGLRYRFLEAQCWNGEDEYKATSERGSRFGVEGAPVLFGTAALDWDEDRTSQTVVLVEGELNAMSIRQATGWHVFSYGSESSTRLHPKQIAFLGTYARRIVWADKPEIALKLRAHLPDAIAIQSPKTPDAPKGLDANDLLQMGMLEGFLQHMAHRQTVQVR